MNPQDKTKEQLLAELNEFREKYADLVYFLPDALIQIDIIKQNLVYMNQMAFALLGYTQEDFKNGIPPSDLFAENEFERAKQLVSSYISESRERNKPYLRKSKQIIYEFLMRKKDGSVFHAETQTSLVLDKNKIPIGMRTIIRDATPRKKAEDKLLQMTAEVGRRNAVESTNKKLQEEVAERKRVEKALRRSEERYRELYQNTPSMYFTVDSEGKVISVNTFGAQQLGYSVDELIGQSVLDVFHEADKKTVLEKLKVSVQNLNQIHNWEFRKIRKDGSMMWVREAARALKNEDGNIVVFIVCEDVTELKHAEQERKKLERQLQHAQKMESLGELAGGLAHDFNNLLTGILGNASLVKMEISPESPAWENAELIEKASLKAAELTNQLLAYAGKGKYVVKHHDPSGLIESMGQLLDSAVSKKIELKYELARNLPPFEADANQMQQVIMELVSNSSDAIGEKDGTISVRTGTEEISDMHLNEMFLNEELASGLYVFVEVADTGCGMDEETQSKIFDPFFSTKFLGRGLGMAAVLGIVRGHQGAIKLSSIPEQGTTIKVLFPAVTEPPKVASKIKEEKEKYGRSTILVVDDEEAALMVAQKILEKFGFKVLSAKDGLEGVEVFNKHSEKINAVLLDMSMPKMSGEEALLEMRNIRPDVRVILLSGYNEDEAMARFGADGLAGFIKKPYRPEMLVTKLDEIL